MMVLWLTLLANDMHVSIREHLSKFKLSLATLSSNYSGVASKFDVVQLKWVNIKILLKTTCIRNFMLATTISTNSVVSGKVENLNLKVTPWLLYYCSELQMQAVYR
jgi:N-methylhydantoinase A/oxoprolinase/acetone carboxylase beta subunit